MERLFFEGRELKPFAEPVTPDSLEIGGVYFRVQFVDARMTVPTLEPVVFIGRDLFHGESGLYFQDAGSFFAGQNWQDQANENDILIYREEHDQRSLYDYEQALNILLRCSLARRNIRS